MTPKEKAEELIIRFLRIKNKPDWGWTGMDREMAKQCALIAVDEVLGYMGSDRGTEFWQEVKIEIEKL